MDRPVQPDRYEPLPPLIQIPGHLVRKLSPRGKRIALMILAAFVLALAVGIPALVAAKHRSDARGTAAKGLAGAEALTARRALAADLAAAVTADAARRAGTGEFAQRAQ